MQYKIPVQIENDDPIFLGLSLKQLIILMIGGGIGYSLFQSLIPSVGSEVAAIPGIIIFLFTLIVVLFKHSEMTFIPFMLNLIRKSINSDPKIWSAGVDSHQPIDIGYTTKSGLKKEKEVNTDKKIDQIKELQDRINKI